MNWLDLLYEIFDVCIIPLIGVLTYYLVNFIKAKSKEIIMKTDNETTGKYIEMLTQTVTDCVIATNQTYVDSLKTQGKFDADAQEKAFKLTYNAVLNILTDDAKEYLTQAYGDLNTYLIKKIEAEVGMAKKTS